MPNPRVRKHFVHIIWTRYVDPLPPMATTLPRVVGAECAKPYKKLADAQRMCEALNKTAKELKLNCEYFVTSNELQ